MQNKKRKEVEKTRGSGETHKKKACLGGHPLFEVDRQYPDLQWRTCTVEKLAVADKPLTQAEVLDELKRLEGFAHFGLEHNLGKVRAFCAKAQASFEGTELKAKLVEAEERRDEACEVADKGKDINVSLLKQHNLVMASKNEPISKLKEEVSGLEGKVVGREGTALEKEVELMQLRGKCSVAERRAFRVEEECSFLQRSLDALRAQFARYHERVIECFQKSRPFQVAVSKLCS